MDDESSQYRGQAGSLIPQDQTRPSPTRPVAPGTTPLGIFGSAISWIFGPQATTTSVPLLSSTPTVLTIPTIAPILPATPSPTFALWPTRGPQSLRPSSTSTLTSTALPTASITDGDMDDVGLPVITPHLPTATSSSLVRGSTFATLASSSSVSFTALAPLTIIQPLPSHRSNGLMSTRSISISRQATSRTSSSIATTTADVSPSRSSEGNQTTSKSSTSMIGGIAGGISGAIVLALLVLLCWKLRKKRERNLDKRSSFDPYANGIDASRGGLLVSSVPYKPADQLSGKETLYSDDHSPTRYEQKEAKTSTEIPPSMSMESTPRTYTESPQPTSLPPPPPAAYPPITSYPAPPVMLPTEDAEVEPFPAYQPMPAMYGQAPPPMRSHHPRPYPQLYDRRRPPVPPSMRRARSPKHRMYGSYPPRPNPILNEGIPGVQAMEPSRLGFAGPYPQSSNVLRSNSMQGYYQSRHAEMAMMERNRQIQRSASMGSMHQQGRNTYQSFRSSPDGPYAGVPRPPSRSHRPHPMMQNYGIPADSNVYGFLNDQGSHHYPKRGLTVRNPTPVYASTPSPNPIQAPSNLVQRATNNTSNAGDSQHKPEHAARNF